MKKKEMLRRCFVIVLEQGDYADYMKRIVAICLSKGKAEEIVSRCNKEIAEYSDALAAHDKARRESLAGTPYYLWSAAGKKWEKENPTPIPKVNFDSELSEGEAYCGEYNPYKIEEVPLFEDQ